MDEAAHSRSITPAALPLHYGNTMPTHEPACIQNIALSRRQRLPDCEQLPLLLVLFPLRNVMATRTAMLVFNLVGHSDVWQNVSVTTGWIPREFFNFFTFPWALMMVAMYLTQHLLYYEADVVDVVLTQIWKCQMSVIGLIIITISRRGRIKETTEKRKTGSCRVACQCRAQRHFYLKKILSSSIHLHSSVFLKFFFYQSVKHQHVSALMQLHRAASTSVLV